MQITTAKPTPDPTGQTYAVLLTPPGRGAVATVLLSGPRVVEFVAREFRPANKKPFEKAAINAIVFGRWGAEPAEEVVVARSAADCVEIHCHGGVAASRAILSALEAHGATIVRWQEWLALEEPDPIRAAARLALADARTERTATILLDQYNGALRREIERIVEMIDVQERPCGAAGKRNYDAQAAIEDLLAFAPLGLHLTRPWRVILAGPPNVGKSSLINALVGYERAIVFDQPGTTRDVVKAVTAFDGWSVELADTAGLRASRDPLEVAGIERARQQLATTDGIVLVFDATEPFTAEDETLASEYPRAILVRNKCDLVANEKNHPEEPGAEERFLLTSAVTGEGIADLQRRIVEHLVPALPAPGGAVPFTAEQAVVLRQADEEITAMNTSAAMQALRRLITIGN